MKLPTEEQLMLRDMAHGWAQESSPVTRFRSVRDGGDFLGFDSAAYSEIAQLGWCSTLISEDYGGVDMGASSMVIILEELGRTLAAAPLVVNAFASVVALQESDCHELAAYWLPKVAEGNVVVSLAVDESNHFSPTKINTRVSEKSGKWVLSGRKVMVHEGFAAELILVLARNERDERVLCAILADADGLEKSPRGVFDARGYADMEFNRVPVLAVIEGDSLIERVLDGATLGYAAEGLGLSIEAFNITLEYLKTRQQFGQLIGSFQALQHRAARLYSAIELAKPCVNAAAEAFDVRNEDTGKLISLAKVTINELMNLMTREMIQLHGGISMTDEHDAGLYLKRARVLEQAFGSTEYHQNRFGKFAGY